jgi:hypothetical protein
LKTVICGVLGALFFILPQFALAEDTEPETAPKQEAKNAIYPTCFVIPPIVAMIVDGWGIGAGYERSFEDHFSVMGNFMLFGAPKFDESPVGFVLFGAATGRYYFADTILKGGYIGLTLVYIGTYSMDSDVSDFSVPGITASIGYKWRIGSNIYIEPELHVGIFYTGLASDYSYNSPLPILPLTLPMLNIGFVF